MPKWSEYGEYWAPSATGLYQAYINMLQTCVNTVPSPEQQQQIKEIENQLNAAQTTLSSNINEKNYAFVQAQNDVPPGVPPPQYAQWYKSSGWEARIQSAQANVVRLAGIQENAVKQQNHGYNTAIMPPQCLLDNSAFESPGLPSAVLMAMMNGGQTTSYPMEKTG